MTEQYQNLLKEVVKSGDVFYEPRTQEHVIGISSFVMNYDLREGFPNLTTKNVPPRLPFEEVLWKLRGERNVKPLVDRNVNIWTANAFDRYLKFQGLREKIPKHTEEWNEKFEWYTEKIKSDPEFAKKAGDLGPVYGFQWRHWEKKDGSEVDQLKKVLDGIKNNPGSRYHILNAWNVGELEEMALGPCPFWHQFSVYGDHLDLTMIQRSNDIYLGAPFNEAQDAFLLELVANETGLIPRNFNYHTINSHIYLGVAPRSDFWQDEKNISEFKKRFSEVNDKEGYLELKEWYLSETDEESKGNERKDHMPFVLEQLSKEPRPSPTMELLNPEIPLLEAIHIPALEIAKVNNYNPHKWKSKAEMAA
jgi:thymidylate synthase